MAEGDATFSNDGLALDPTSWGTDDWRIMLVDNVWVPDRDADQFISDGPRANEHDGANYTANGAALANESVTVDDTNDRVVYDADPVTWSDLGAGTNPLGWAVLYNNTPATDAAKPIMCWWELTQNADGNDYTLTPPATGYHYTRQGA